MLGSKRKKLVPFPRKIRAVCWTSLFLAILLAKLNTLDILGVPDVSLYSEVSLSVCIPAIFKDVRSGALERVVQSVRYQTVQPDKLIIVLTGVPSYEEVRTRRKLLRSARGINLTLVTHQTLQLQSESRNEGLSLAETDVVSFFDADDLMHETRLKVIKQLFRDKDVSVVLHNYTTDFSDRNWARKAEDIIVSNTKSVCDSELRTRGRQIPLDICVHHAHVSVRRADLHGLRYDSSLALHRFEDSLFVRKFLAQVCPGPKKAIFVHNQLSLYNV